MLKRIVADEDWRYCLHWWWQINNESGLKKQPFLEDKVLKLKTYKETWNQASRIQVRGGLLGYKSQSTAT